MMLTDSGVVPEVPVVEVQDLYKSFGEVKALRGVSFQIPSDAVVGFLGLNGAGKTTVMKVLTGYLAPDQGFARVCGHQVDQEPLAARELVGYLPENNPLYQDMRVDQFLQFAWKAQNRSEARESMSAAIDRVVLATGLQPVFRRGIAACSKGYRQRVGLSQALLHDPPLLILDEPTNGLDPIQVVEIRELIRELGKRKTVLLTTHILSEVEALADRVVLIHQGKKVADGRLKELAQAGQGPSARIVFRASQSKCEDLIHQIGGSVLQWLQAPFADPRNSGAIVRLPGAGGQEALLALSKKASEQNLRLLELTPHTGSLEMLFKDLQAGVVKA
jgi:ABC-2 type transport system ATP-binding protein